MEAHCTFDLPSSPGVPRPEIQVIRVSCRQLDLRDNEDRGGKSSSTLPNRKRLDVSSASRTRREPPSSDALPKFPRRRAFSFSFCFFFFVFFHFLNSERFAFYLLLRDGGCDRRGGGGITFRLARRTDWTRHVENVECKESTKNHILYQQLIDISDQ